MHIKGNTFQFCDVSIYPVCSVQSFTCLLNMNAQIVNVGMHFVYPCVHIYIYIYEAINTFLSITKSRLRNHSHNVFTPQQ